jgi:hypothetical protein
VLEVFRRGHRVTRAWNAPEKYAATAATTATHNVILIALTICPSAFVRLKPDATGHFFEPAFFFARRGAAFFLATFFFAFVALLLFAFVVALLLGFEAALRFGPAAFFFVGATRAVE